MRSLDSSEDVVRFDRGVVRLDRDDDAVRIDHTVGAGRTEVIDDGPDPVIKEDVAAW
jgi:hypothetical protein